MREIKFRGRRIDNEEWIYGSLITHSHMGVDKYFIAPEGMAQIYATSHKVISETVSQYTGLKDKDGREVYEGDVLVYDDTPYSAYASKQTGSITWRRGAFCFSHMFYGSMHYSTFNRDDFFEQKSKIIGNIHDNPELLKEAPHD